MLINILESDLYNSIKKGIDLTRYSQEQISNFMIELVLFINNEGNYNSYHYNNRITIETFFYDPLLEVYVETNKKTLQFVPITDDGWLDPIFDILKFIYINYENEIQKELKRRIKKENEHKELDWI